MKRIIAFAALASAMAFANRPEDKTLKEVMVKAKKNPKKAQVKKEAKKDVSKEIKDFNECISTLIKETEEAKVLATKVFKESVSSYKERIIALLEDVNSIEESDNDEEMIGKYTSRMWLKKYLKALGLTFDSAIEKKEANAEKVLEEVSKLHNEIQGKIRDNSTKYRLTALFAKSDLLQVKLKKLLPDISREDMILVFKNVRKLMNTHNELLNDLGCDLSILNLY